MSKSAIGVRFILAATLCIVGICALSLSVTRHVYAVIKGKQKTFSPCPKFSWLEGNRRILVLGDSRIAILSGWTAPNDAQFECFGFPGAMAADLAQLVPAALEKNHPDLLIIQVGVNDTVLASLSNWDSESTLTRVQAAWSSIDRACIQKNVPLRILPVIPPGAPSFFDRVLGRAGAPKQVLVLNTSSSFGIRDIANAAAWPWSGKTKNPDEWRLDFLHLNAAGNDALKKAIEEVAAKQSLDVHRNGDAQR